VSETARARANAAQMRAADPAVSAFVAASAGSGKTKLLTDRLLRLMLGGADPGRIQCLTFTKAAAAEMALRLQATLGKWVTLPDDKLDTALAERGIVPTAANRVAARALFARVLDLPGGMRIETIHAFCQSLLRRFPLEAQLSPHFSVVQDADARVARRDAQEQVLAAAHDMGRRAALQSLAGLVSLQDFSTLSDTLLGAADKLATALCDGPDAMAARLAHALGGETDADALMVRAVTWPEEPQLRAVVLAIATLGSPQVKSKALRLLDWLSLRAKDRAANWPSWRCEFLCDDGTPRGPTTLINAKLAGQRADLSDVMLAEQARVLAVEDAGRAGQVAALSAALASLALPVAQAYAARKSGAGQLDFDDLIGRTSALLVDPGAAWVLYKLDGGLDHLLLDEVQDTAPAQWRIAGALTAEFFAGAGAGARDAGRTVFAVGDRKQSIYSFQGARPDAFDTWRERLRRRVLGASERWEDVTVDVSFRSTAPVLRLVDAVFAAPDAAAGVVAAGETLTHYPDRVGHAGRVELWPLVPRPDVAAPEPWRVPDENVRSRSAMDRLAEALAEWIARETGGGVMLDSRGRPLGPGDVLVLVRRRNAFARALVRALKGRGVPVAGLDRLVLTDQPAVADLLALADTLLLAEDSLSLAAVLTSPLGGLSDDSLMALAAYRADGQTLWDALRARAGERAEWQAAWDFLSALLRRVDFVTPHALLVEALGPLGGRARLLARLGPEAAEPIDELLNAALDYAATAPPSLQGFVQWLRLAGAEVKRQAEGAGGSVRIMTVHNAKGLQAPLVILPDTAALPPDDARILWTDDGLPVWTPLAGFRCAASDALREKATRLRLQEHNRLLYVALTRAEDRLLVCGWQPARVQPDACWYNLVQRGFSRLAAAAAPFAVVADPWDGAHLVDAEPQRRDPDTPERHGPPTLAQPMPAWAARRDPPPAEAAPPVPLAPSHPADANLGSVPHAASPLAERDATGLRFRRGRLVHALLQHLPALPQTERAAAARRYLARPGHDLAPGEAEIIAREVLSVLAHPGLAPLFGPEGRAEVPLTGVIGGRVVGGLVDRLAVLPDRVLIADYKANRAPPASLAATPVLYLRQMAAYRDVLRAIYPDRRVICALVWTAGAQVVTLPDELLDASAAIA
jgi:ATP-dependent helicase/nuclease subunit A